MKNIHRYLTIGLLIGLGMLGGIVIGTLIDYEKIVTKRNNNKV